MKIGILGLSHFFKTLLQDSGTQIFDTEVLVYPNQPEIPPFTIPKNWHVEYSLESLFQQVDFIFIDLMWRELVILANQIRTCITDHHVLISLNAGFSIVKLNHLMNERKQVLMLKNPLVPLSLTPIVLWFHSSVSSQERQTLTELLSCAKECMITKTEDELQALRPVVEQSSLFVSMLLEAMGDGVWSCGVSRQQAWNLAVQSLKGWFNSTACSASLNEVMQQLPASSCLATLEKHHFRYAIIDAIKQINHS